MGLGQRQDLSKSRLGYKEGAEGVMGRDSQFPIGDRWLAWLGKHRS